MAEHRPDLYRDRPVDDESPERARCLRRRQRVKRMRQRYAAGLGLWSRDDLSGVDEVLRGVGTVAQRGADRTVQYEVAATGMSGEANHDGGYP